MTGILAAALAAAVLLPSSTPEPMPAPTVVVAIAFDEYTDFELRDLAGAVVRPNQWLLEHSQEPGCDNRGLGTSYPGHMRFHWYRAACRAQGRAAGVVTAVWRDRLWECRSSYVGFAAGTGLQSACELHARSAPLQIIESVQLTRLQLAEREQQLRAGELTPALLRREESAEFYSGLLNLPGRSLHQTGALLYHLARASGGLETLARTRTQNDRELAVLSLFWAQQFFAQDGVHKLPVAARPGWARISVDVKLLRSRVSRGALTATAAATAARDLRLRIRKLTARLPAVWGKPFSAWYADVEAHYVAWGLATDSSSENPAVVSSLRAMSAAAERVAVRVRTIWSIRTR